VRGSNSSAGRPATKLDYDRTIPVKAVRGGTAELLHVIEPQAVQKKSRG
jgi:hypothetical protein